jgi:hypothetical protein
MADEKNGSQHDERVRRMVSIATMRVRASWGSRMAEDWIENYIAERLREHDERVRQRELKQSASASRRAKIVEERQRRTEERARLRESRCGAKTRAGGSCQCKGLGRGGRCKFHGGLSSGPKTEAGRRRIAEAQRKRWAARRGK